MNINEIAKTMTRDEFIHNLIYNDVSREYYFQYKDEKFDCPSYIIGLDDRYIRVNCGGTECKKMLVKFY